MDEITKTGGMSSGDMGGAPGRTANEELRRAVQGAGMGPPEEAAFVLMKDGEYAAVRRVMCGACAAYDAEELRRDVQGESPLGEPGMCRRYPPRRVQAGTGRGIWPRVGVRDRCLEFRARD